MEDATRLDMARDLVRELECGNQARADEIVQAIARERESNLFKEVGKLTRDLHDALISVERDSRLAGIAENEIPDAKERLRYVISKTEAAADRTLSAVEDLMPIAEKLGRESVRLNAEWSRFARREMNLDEFKYLSGAVAQFFVDIQADTGRLHANLSEVLIAQDYQDLTGQVIRKVIELVQEVEDKLVDLVRVSGGRAARANSPKSKIAPEGPAINASGHAGAVTSQDEVDDLLLSLGF